MKLIIIGVVLIWTTILPSNIAEKIRFKREELEDIWKQTPLEYDEQCVKWCTNNKKTKGLFARPHQYNSPIQMSNRRMKYLRADKKAELFPPEFFAEFYEKIKEDGEFLAQKSQIDHTQQDRKQLPNREYLEHIFEDNIGHQLKKHTSENFVSQEEPMESMEEKQLIINQDNIMKGPSTGYSSNNMQGSTLINQGSLMQGPPEGYLGNNMQGSSQGYSDNNMQGPFQLYQGYIMQGPSGRYPGNNIQEPFQSYPGNYMQGRPQGYLIRSQITNSEEQSENFVSQEEPVESMEGKQLIINQGNIMNGPSASYLGNNMQGSPGGYPCSNMQGPSGGYPSNNMQGHSQDYLGNNMQGPPQGNPGNNIQGSHQSNQDKNMQGFNKNRPGLPLLPSFPQIMKHPPICPIGCMPIPFFQSPKFPFMG